MAGKNYEGAKYFTIAFGSAFIMFSLLALGTALIPLGGMAETPAQLPQEDVAVDEFYDPRPEDSITVLLTAALGEKRCFALAGLDVEAGRITARYLPPELVVQYRRSELTLAKLYSRDGPLAAKEALTQTLGVEVERWMAFGEQELVQAADAIGPVGYAPGGDEKQMVDSGPRPAQGTRRLDGNSLQELLFAQQPEPQKVQMAVEAFLHAALLQSVEPTADDLFRELVDLADTDISYLDYDNRREALHFLAGLLG